MILWLNLPYLFAPRSRSRTEHRVKHPLSLCRLGTWVAISARSATCRVAVVRVGLLDPLNPETEKESGNRDSYS